MRRTGALPWVALRGLLAGTLLIVGCGDAVEVREGAPPKPVSGDTKLRGRAAVKAPPPKPKSTRSPHLADGDLGSYEPPEADVTAAAALANPETRDDAWLDVLDLDTGRKIAVLRAALRFRDPAVARAAACELDWTQLDPWEISRMIELRLDAAFDPELVLPSGGPVPWADLHDGAGWQDVAALLDRLAAWPTGREPPDLEGLAAMHKALRADALDAIARHLRRPDAPGTDDVVDMLGQIALRTDGHREEIAAALLGETVEGARSRFPDPADLVRAALASNRVRESSAPWSFRNWGGRWLAEIRPARATADSPDDSGPDCEIPDNVVLYMLRRNPDRGRELLLGVPPPEGEEDPDDLACGMLSEFEDGLREMVPWDPRWDATFRGFDVLAAAGERLSARTLVRIATIVPGCRTRILADAILAKVPGDRWPFAKYSLTAETCDPALPFLETAAPEAFLDRLRRWAGSADADTRSSAIQALVALRDVESAPVILRWAAELREGNHASVPWHALGELPHPTVRAFLVRHVEEAEGSTAPSVRQALEAIAWFDGFHCGSGWTERVHAEAVPEIRRLVLERRGADAFFAAAAIRDEPFYEGLAGVRDPRIVPHLRALRDRRELGLYAQVTGELALAGDKEAREEVLSVIRSGRYRWVDQMSDRVRSLGDARAMVPVWLEALESNCCAEGAILSWFTNVFGVLEPDTKGAGATASAHVRAWFARHENRFVESRLAGRLVPAPR